MAKMAPALPVVGPDSRFQPVYVDDVAAAVAKACTGEAEAGATYELGGPRDASFRELLELMLSVIRRKRPIVAVPIPVAKIQGIVLGQLARIGIAPPITLDQVKMLERNNVVSQGAKSLADLGIAPTSMEAILPAYLARFRPSGQYDRMADAGEQG
jgi:NADH dehydrogenase